MSKWETIKGSAGFFATMAVFLLAVGLSGYFLLLDKEEEPLPVIVEEPAETTVSAGPSTMAGRGSSSLSSSRK